MLKRSLCGSYDLKRLGASPGYASNCLLAATSSRWCNFIRRPLVSKLQGCLFRILLFVESLSLGFSAWIQEPGFYLFGSKPRGTAVILMPFSTTVLCSEKGVGRLFSSLSASRPKIATIRTSCLEANIHRLHGAVR
jgi:hypothetical protein